MSYHTGATFVPGGEDAYYMPEVIQPTPHRVGQHPNNMQHNVSQMEQAASSPQTPYSGSVYSPNYADDYSSGGWANSRPPINSTQSYSEPSYNQHSFQQPTLPTFPQSDQYQPPQPAAALPEQPNFSPFPILRNPGPNVPPTDEEKEARLESARASVLSCNDPETQLMWAQDALTYVEVCQQNEERVALAQTPRSRTPRIEHVLKEDAVKIVAFLADQHHPRAEFMRGMWLEFGKFGNRVDKKEAFHCYTRASEKGYTRALYRIGMQFESSNDALKAIKYYQRAADAGDSASCYRLGMMTLLGQHGQAQSYERGLQLIYTSAQTADENAPQGAYVFGMLQSHQMPQVQVPEHYLPKDIAAAKMNIEKAAFLGFAKAQVKMGAAYELSELGCGFDPALSLHYNALAARQGEAEAELAISKWFLCGHEGLFEKNEEMAFTYAQRAALSGFATAQFAMGYYYEVGIYVPSNFSMAKEWYQKASQGGNSDAGGRIDAISRSKTLSRKDHESVALSKIRAKRGSMMGGSAASGVPPVPPMPPMPSVSEADEPAALDMPDPSRLNLRDNRPQQRPGSAAPYPTGNPNMPSANSGPEFRPTSAFGINPNLRTNTPGNMGSSRPPSNQYGPSHPSSGQRPYVDSRQSYPQEGRRPSGPQNVPQLRQPSRPGSTSPYMPAHSGRGSPAPQPPMKVDIGFTAPLEPERKPRPMHPGGGERPPSNGPPRNSSRPGQPQQVNPQQRPDRVNTPQGRPANYQQQPPMTKLQQQKQQYSQPPPNVKPANMAPSKPNPNAPSGQTQPSKPNSVSASQAPSRPPGKGPKTFDEMGVPAGKDKGDCRVM